MVQPKIVAFYGAKGIMGLALQLQFIDGLAVLLYPQCDLRDHLHVPLKLKAIGQPPLAIHSPTDFVSHILQDLAEVVETLLVHQPPVGLIVSTLGISVYEPSRSSLNQLFPDCLVPSELVPYQCFHSLVSARRPVGRVLDLRSYLSKLLEGFSFIDFSSELLIVGPGSLVCCRH